MIMKILANTLFICSLLSGTTVATEVIVNDPDWPPYFFKGESYQPVGFAKEVLKTCIAKTQYDAKFVYHPIKRMRDYIEKGKLDIHVYSYKESRESFLVFGKEPIFNSSYRPFINTKAPFEIHNFNDFNGLRIGHLQGLKYSNDYLHYLENQMRAGYVRSVTTNIDLITLLHEKKIDVFVNTVDTVYWLATTLGMRDHIKAVDFDIQTKDYFVTVSKRSSAISDKRAFLNTLDDCIKTLKQNGDYVRIRTAYGM